MRLRCACGAEYEVTAKSYPSNGRERRLCVGCRRPLVRIASTGVFEFKFVSAIEAQAKKGLLGRCSGAAGRLMQFRGGLRLAC